MNIKEKLEEFYQLYEKGYNKKNASKNLANYIDYFEARHFLVKALEQQKQELVEEVEKLRKYEIDSGVWGDAGREDAFEDVIKLIKKNEHRQKGGDSSF